MPKKSRREKMLADIRRRVRTEHVITTPPAVSPIQTHDATFHFNPSPGSKVYEPVLVVDTELPAIKRDLTKTVILAGIAITAELALYWFGRGKI
jgi:hypothetical protein